MCDVMKASPSHRAPSLSAFAAMVILAGASIGTGCKQAREADTPLTLTPPVQRDDGWAVASLGQAGFDETAMLELTRAIRGGDYPETHAVVVEHAGRLVYEAYFKGEDERWGKRLGHVFFDAETLHDLRSVTKSVTTALLGIALGGDYQAALDRPLVQYFGDLKGKFGPGVGQVTLRQVLTMTAGLEWNEMEVPYTNSDNDEIRMSYTRDPVAMVLGRPLRDPPGTKWYYNGGLTQVVAGIIERETGKPIDEFAEDVLFEPLGITRYEWLGSRAWPRGSSPSAASGLRLRARDLAKIGSLMLHEGRWNGRQVIPAEWIQLSIERSVQDIPWGPDGAIGYGFMWYPGRTLGESGYEIVGAMGNGDQRIYIMPEQKIVVTVFGGLYNRRDIRNGSRILAKVMAARGQAD